MKSIEAVARTVVTDRQYKSMPKDSLKRMLVNAMAAEIENILSDKELSIEYIPGTERGPAMMVSVPFKIQFGELAPTFNLGPHARMDQDDIVKYSNGNPGALMILTREVYGHDRIAEAIKYHDLRGDKLYVIFNDCCGRDVDLFEGLLNLDREVIQDLLDGYKRTGRGRSIERSFLLGRKCWRW